MHVSNIIMHYADVIESGWYCIIILYVCVIIVQYDVYVLRIRYLVGVVDCSTEKNDLHTALF